MTDPVISIPPNPNPTATAADASSSSSAQQNPLDALEAILQEAKAKAVATNSGSNGAGAETKSIVSDAAELAAAQEAKKQADLEVILAANRITDAASLKLELANLSQVSNSSEDKARVQQNKAEDQNQVTQQQKRDEFVINQLGHTKI